MLVYLLVIPLVVFFVLVELTEFTEYHFQIWYADCLARMLSKRSVKYKRRLFSGIHDAAIERKLGDAAPLTVVEINAASTVNLMFYPDGIKLICSNRLFEFGYKFMDKSDDFPDIEFRFVWNEPDQLTNIPNESADAAVMSFSLSCSGNIRGTLREALRILKPVGPVIQFI